MDGNFYRIHNLIDVIISQNVNDLVLQQIEFQIAYFKVNKIETKAPYCIYVLPFSEYPENDSVLYTFHLVKGIHGSVMLDRLNHIAVIKEKNGYSIYTDIPFLINLFIQFIFLEEDIALVHAAAIADKDGNIILLPGAGGVGKTTLLSVLVKDYKYKLLGDDIVGITKKGECLAFPRSFVLKDYHRTVYPEVFQKLGIVDNNKKNIIKAKIVELIRANIPFLGFIKIVLRSLNLFDKVKNTISVLDVPYLAAVPVEDIFGRGIVTNIGKIDRIIFLERYMGTESIITPISKESLTHRMFAIINHEFVDVMRQFFTLGALEIIDSFNYFKKITSIISSCISETKNELMLIPDDKSPLELNNEFLKQL